MPLYEYVCPACGAGATVLQKINDPRPACALCTTEMNRVPSAPSIQFKGSGWTPKGPGRRR